jgi:hypothetical protein
MNHTFLCAHYVPSPVAAVPADLQGASHQLRPGGLCLALWHEHGCSRPGLGIKAVPISLHVVWPAPCTVLLWLAS